MVSQIHVWTHLAHGNGRMISPVWYNIRRVGPQQYLLQGEHDVDVGWMNDVRGTDSRGEKVGRIVPRFAADGWDKDAYEEVITHTSAQEQLVNMIIAQIQLLPWGGG
jgi:hypothetical protein